MTVIIDYGAGNLFSLEMSLKSIGEKTLVSGEKEHIEAADRLILPGVGAFEDAAKKLRCAGLDAVIKAAAKKGTPLLGICLGMQLLFGKSYEYGEHEGLSLIRGEVVPMKGSIPEDLKIPHIGWNALEFKNDSPLFSRIKNGGHVYFVHSFYADKCEADTIAVTEYGRPITAAVGKDNVFGCQFHPEKSGSVGLEILRAFCEYGRQ